MAGRPLNILFLESVGYESALRLSGHHYARILNGMGQRAVSVSSPVTPFHMAGLGRGAVRTRFVHAIRGWIEAPGGTPHHVPFTWIPVRSGPLFGGERALRLSAAGWRRSLMNRLRSAGFEPDVLCIQNPMFEPAADDFPRALVHLRVEDWLAGFEGIAPSLVAAEARLKERAGVISVTANRLMESLPAALRSKTMPLPNGADFEAFSAPSDRPPEYPEGRPVVLYAGALREWFDWDTHLAAIRALPEFLFAAVSPDLPPRAALALLNFLWIPGRPYENLPAYYRWAAASVIPFKPSPLVEAVNPIKLHESLAAGTPVVAREWAELRAMAPPARLFMTAEEYIAALREAVREGAPPAAAEFARRHSWRANAERLIERWRMEIAARA